MMTEETLPAQSTQGSLDDRPLSRLERTRRRQAMMRGGWLVPWVGLVLGGLAFEAESHEITYDGKICECLGDLDDDGDVDDDDIPLLVRAFGRDCPENEGCLEDLNHNHRVGGGDVQVLMGHLGRCRVEGDVNGDRFVDQDDYDLVVSQQGLACRVDIDGDGQVGGNDMAIAEAAWGPGDDHHPRADIDDDKFLSVTDLMAVFDALGRSCKTDVDGDGWVTCEDLWHVNELGQLSNAEPTDCVPAHP